MILCAGLATVAGLARPASAAAAKPVPYYGAYRELPVGAVKPKGWIKAWLQRQADGLSGHPETMEYPYNTCLFAGTIPWKPEKHGENWWPYEQSAYFIDGATRLSALVDVPNVKAISRKSLSYAILNAAPGKLGPSTWAWPNTIFGRALMAYDQDSGEAGAVKALRTSLSTETSAAGRDGFVAEQWLYLYSKTGEPALLEQARRLYASYFLDNPKSFSNVAKLNDAAPLKEHGVTAAEQLKLAPLYYLHSGDKQALELARTGYDKVVRENMMPDGGMVSSESLGMPAFNSLHETCDLVDWSWGMGYMLMASGEGRWGDAVEKVTFNALPGALTKDFRQVQYFSSPNQVLASNTACPRIAPTRMSYRPAHDTPCCPGNVGRAMPNYVTRMWMTTAAEDGLAATLYGPCEVKARLGNRVVTITETTDYPFRDTIRFDIGLRGSAAFALHLRIPRWCEGARIRINGADSDVDCTPDTFAEVRRTFRDGDRIELTLPMRVTPRTWYNGAAANIERGPLVYALKIEEKPVVWSKDLAAVQAVLHDRVLNGFPAIEFFPNGEWRYGIDAAALTDTVSFTVAEAPMTDNPFVPGAAPVSISVPVRPLPDWQADWKPLPNQPIGDFKTAPKNIAALPEAAQMQTREAPVTMTFVPLGATHLRLTTLPILV
ncbi:MAG TPA: beta-L-arabinofuranosidase domain-containing protein [Asticcacaulis sp.]|nr:beta-L-arabinofuranosidase domain-containing protein [Asticcacaulis sp.]